MTLQQRFLILRFKHPVLFVCRRPRRHQRLTKALKAQPSGRRLLRRTTRTRRTRTRRTRRTRMTKGRARRRTTTRRRTRKWRSRRQIRLLRTSYQRSIVRGVQVLPKKAAKAQVLIKDHFVVSGSCLNAESRWEDFKCRSWGAPTDGASSKGFNPIILFECGSVRCEGNTANNAGCIRGFNQRSLCGERYLFECRVPMGSWPLLGSQERRRLQERFQSYHFV